MAILKCIKRYAVMVKSFNLARIGGSLVIGMNMTQMFLTQKYLTLKEITQKRNNSKRNNS